MKIQEAPSQIHVEATYGCPAQCWFCFTQVLERDPYKYSFLSSETFNNIITQIKNNNWNNTTIKFAVRGEPTLNPHLRYFFKQMQDKELQNPRVIITNGSFLDIELIKDLFQLGLNYLVIDCYENQEEIHKTLLKEETLPEIIIYYEDNFEIYKHKKRTDQKIILMGDLEEYHSIKKEKEFNNHAGNIIEENFKEHGIPLKTTPINKNCNRPFRELAIHYNGTVVQCCEDTGEDNILGNINKDSLYDIWINNNKLNKIREELNKNRRETINPCFKCDYNGT